MLMLIYKTVKDMRNFLLEARDRGNTVGFIPTMGALHAGHISLISKSKEENNLTVCSIFVNPTQFNNREDFEKYPISIAEDINQLEKSGCDLLFLPTVEEVYPPGLEKKHYNLGYLETILEGHYRPGHFQGVCQVVDRLLDIVNPNRLYLGRKDYQQCMVISKLVELVGSRTQIVICETVRERDGLAMSSRNARLNEDQRKQSLAIFRVLSKLRNALKPGDLNALKLASAEELQSQGFRVDYVELADAGNLRILDHWDGHTPVVALVAAYSGQVRLIDNDIIFS